MVIVFLDGHELGNKLRSTACKAVYLALIPGPASTVYVGLRSNHAAFRPSTDVLSLRERLESGLAEPVWRNG